MESKKQSKLVIKKMNSEKIIQYDVDNQFRIRPKFKKICPTLLQSYSENSLMTAIANHNLALFAPIVVPKIRGIKKRKNLSDNDILQNDEVKEILKKRDKELAQLNSEIFNFFFTKKKVKTKNENLKDKILDVLEKNDRIIDLAKKLDMDVDYLKRELTPDRLGMGIIKLKELKFSNLYNYF